MSSAALILSNIKVQGEMISTLIDHEFNNLPMRRIIVLITSIVVMSFSIAAAHSPPEFLTPTDEVVLTLGDNYSTDLTSFEIMPVTFCSNEVGEVALPYIGNIYSEICSNTVRIEVQKLMPKIIINNYKTSYLPGMYNQFIGLSDLNRFTITSSIKS